MSKCLLLCTDNLIDEVVANTFKSSEQTLFPVSNTVDLNRRKRVWRSNGHWEIVSGSNTIIFRETALVNLTATVTPGDYSSTTLFMAALKTALEAAGDSTYTVSLTATGKFSIVSSGGGGGGIFQIIWPSSTAMAGILGYSPAASDVGALTYTADVLRIATDEWIVWDLAFPTNPNAFIAVGDRNTGLKISPSATIRIQGNTTDEWSSPQVDLTVPYFDRILAKWDEDGLAGSASYGYRYWRFKIQDVSNVYSYVEIGGIFLGLTYATTRGAAVFPMGFNGIDRSDIIQAEGGQKYSFTAPKSQSFEIQWDALTKDESETLDQFYQSYGKQECFFVIFDNPEAFSTDSEKWVRLCRFTNDNQNRLSTANFFDSRWAIEEAI